jgi:hypothetical protein
MLYASLNQHPAIALMYEPELQSHDLPQRFFLHEKWLENANAWGKFLFRHGFPTYPKEAAEDFRCPEDFYKAYARRNQAVYGGEKSPTLQTYLPQLVQRFPDAKIITISRNPAAVFRSIQQAGKSTPWFARRYMLERVLYGEERLLQDSIVLQNKGHHILHLTYEDFTTNPEAECRRACSYLGLAFEERMTTLENAELAPVSNSPIHTRLHSQKISPSEFMPPDLSSEWLDMLDAHWQRTRECLSRLSSGERPIPAMAPPAARIQPALRKGRCLHYCRRWRRFLHHLLPAEFIRVYRSAKEIALSSKCIQTEK